MPGGLSDGLLYRRKDFRRSVLIFLGSVLLYGILSAATGFNDGSKPVEVLARDHYGGDEKQVPIRIEGLTDEPVRTTLPVQPREYNQAEAEQLFARIMEQMGEIILLENESLMAVRSDLNLISTWEGARLRWQSDLPEYISQQGKVTNDAAGATGETGYLKVQLRAGDYQQQYEIPVCIYPPIESEEERQIRQFLKKLTTLEQSQKEQAAITLPEEYEGHILSYYKESGTDYHILPLLGAVIAILLFLQAQEQEKQRQKEKEQQMLLDYAEVITKLMVFIGAGMTVRLAWERIACDYGEGRARSSQRFRYIYEEMNETLHQLQSGMPEGKAYEAFGKRCRLQPYLKLSTLLEQNRRSGSKNLRELMGKEVAAAFEQRKNLVRRLGEEAGTKLAGPLFLMLGVIMVLVLFPALMSMR